MEPWAPLVLGSEIPAENEAFVLTTKGEVREYTLLRDA